MPADGDVGDDECEEEVHDQGPPDASLHDVDSLLMHRDRGCRHQPEDRARCAASEAVLVEDEYPC